MTNKVWNFQLDGKNYTVRLKHGYLSGRRTIRLNGKIIIQTGYNLIDGGSNHHFNIGEHQATVLIRARGFKYGYDLIIDDLSIVTGKEVEPFKEYQINIKDFILVIIASMIGGWVSGYNLAELAFGIKKITLQFIIFAISFIIIYLVPKKLLQGKNYW